MKKIATTILSCLMLTNLVVADEIRPGVLRTPDSRFEGLVDFPYEQNYVDIQGYRVHYIDVGPRDGELIYLQHGEPDWSYLFRKMIPVFTAAGYRVIAPDMIGFGRSDKPLSPLVHTYNFHVNTLSEFVKKTDMKDATFFGQDWGGMFGLRVVAENEERFARVVISNTGLLAPTSYELPDMNSQLGQWILLERQWIIEGDINPGNMVLSQTGDPSVVDPYNAPFPDPSYKAGPLSLPQLIPLTRGYEGVAENLAAWEVFRRWQKPFLTAFTSDENMLQESVTAIPGGHRIWQETVPGAEGQAHVLIDGGGHFVQETRGVELAEIIVKFMRDNPLP